MPILIALLLHTQALSEELVFASAVGGGGEDGWSCDCPSCWRAHLLVCLTQGGRTMQAALLSCVGTVRIICVKYGF
ncbi:hypothetical protein DKP78_18450 [Enterococcus faecium]|nr:hypothetical protein DKP78_18450 [Enterococcus faecium]